MSDMTYMYFRTVHFESFFFFCCHIEGIETLLERKIIAFNQPSPTPFSPLHFPSTSSSLLFFITEILNPWLKEKVIAGKKIRRFCTLFQIYRGGTVHHSIPFGWFLLLELRTVVFPSQWLPSPKTGCETGMNPAAMTITKPWK